MKILILKSSAKLTYMKKKTALISAAWDNTDTVFAVVDAYYRQLCSYMDFQGTS